MASLPVHDSDRFYLRGADGVVTRTTDLVAWGRFMEGDIGRVLERTDIADGCFVSTCFLGMHSGFRQDVGPEGPALFETIVTRPSPEQSAPCSSDDSWQEQWRWVRARTVVFMTKERPSDRAVQTGSSTRSVEEKLRIVMAAVALATTNDPTPRCEDPRGAR